MLRAEFPLHDLHGIPGQPWLRVGPSPYVNVVEHQALVWRRELGGQLADLREAGFAGDLSNDAHVLPSFTVRDAVLRVDEQYVGAITALTRDVD